MSRYDEDQMYNSGNSRARNSSRSRSSASRGRTGSSGTRSSASRGTASRGTSARGVSGHSSSGTRSTSARGSSSRYGSSSHGRGHGKGKRRQEDDFKKLAVGGVLLIAAITLIVFFIKGMDKEPLEMETETEITSSVPETELQKEVLVDGVNITGMSREQAREAILENYPWAMTVSWQEDTYEITDLMGGKVDTLLTEIYSGEPKEKYSLDTDGLEEAAAAEAAKAAAKWDKAAKNGSISSYDKASDKFLFTGAEQGQALDQEKLTKDILDAVKKKDFDAKLTAVMNPVEPEFSEETAKEKYKTIGTFTTKTTSNSKRNTNVKLSAGSYR